MNHLQRAIQKQLLAPQGITDGATVTANLDTKGHDAVSIVVNCAAEESTHAANSTLSLLQSDDTVVTNFATIVANKSLDLAAAKVHRYEVDMKGKKRYLRLSVTAGTTTGGNITVGAVAALHRSAEEPSGTTDILASTSDSVQVV